MKGRNMSLRSARRDDERGAILVMSALFLVVMVVACALAIDLGQQAKDKRDDHKIADLVSLDAVRALDDINGGCTDAQQQTYVESKAHDAAVRNSYDPSVSGHSLVVDIGNTQTVIGLYKDDELTDHWRIATNHERTSDEHFTLVDDFLRHREVSLLGDVSGVAVASVVPRLTAAFREMTKRYLKFDAMVLADSSGCAAVRSARQISTVLRPRT